MEDIEKEIISVNLEVCLCNRYKDISEYCNKKELSAVVDLSLFHNLEEFLNTGINATAKKKYRRSIKWKVETKQISIKEWNEHLQEIYEINTSTNTRQNRPMSGHYNSFPNKVDENQGCKKHPVYYYGAFVDGKLVSYCKFVKCGEIIQFITIIGHHDYLKYNIMVNMWAKVVEECLKIGSKYLLYYHWECASKELQFWKHSVGCKPVLLVEKNS